MWTLLLLLLPPLAASGAAALIRRRAHVAGWVGGALCAVSLGAALRLSIAAGGAAPGDGPGLWRVDALSALLAVAVAFVTLLAWAVAPALHAGGDDPGTLRRLRVYVGAFAFTMLLAVSVQNVALMWVAIEATTVASALAIPLRRSRASVEASWKYLLVCSVGIALAFTGTILAYFDFVATAGHAENALNWVTLRQAAPGLHGPLLQLAFAFILVGYGTKAGLAPMHTWLPDAHSEAPAPISAMMSGVLLAVALYAIARWKAVVDAAIGPAFTSTLLIAFGLASVAIGALNLVMQRHYKRMLGYSSVEHMGLAAIGLALGPLGMFAGWLHVLNHAVAKAAGFLLAGRILGRFGTGDIRAVTGLLQVMPWTGGLFAATMLALVGLPPFGLFVSEFLLVQAAIAADRTWLAAAVLGLLLTAFVSLLAHTNAMLYGDPPEGVAIGERASWPAALLAVPLLVLVLLGVVLPGPVAALVRLSAGALTP